LNALNIQLSEQLLLEIQQQAVAHGMDVEAYAAQLLARAIAEDRREAHLMEEIRKDREQMARQGVYITDDFITQAKRWGRK